VPRPRKKSATDAVEADTPLFFSQQLKGALPKAAQVYDLVRTAIIQLALRPGAAINEKAICEQLQISRTPLREAIIQLANDGLVEVLPNSGTFVSPIDLRLVFDGQLVRAALELRAVGLAARKADRALAQQLDFNMHQQRVLAADNDYNRFYDVDEAMHQLICEFGSSNRVWRIVTGAKGHLDRVRRLQIPEKDHLEVILAEHAAIIGGVLRNDEAAAHRAMSAHINRVFKTVRHLLNERSEFFAPNSHEQLDRFDQLAI